MKYIITTANLIEHFGEKPTVFRERFIYWSGRESFEEVANLADQNGTWQTWLETTDEAEARREWKRVKAMAGLTEVFKSPRTGCMGYKETAFKFEADNEDEFDPNQIGLLDWHAEGYEHEPEAEGSEE